MDTAKKTSSSLSAFSVYNQRKKVKLDDARPKKKTDKKRKHEEDSFENQLSPFKATKSSGLKKKDKKKKHVTKATEDENSDYENAQDTNISDQETGNSSQTFIESFNLNKKTKHGRKSAEDNFPNNENEQKNCSSSQENQDLVRQSLERSICRKWNGPCNNVVAEKCFKCIIEPLSVRKFFEQFWEKNYAYIGKKDPTYWSDMFSCQDFDALLRQNKLEFSKHIDVTKCVNGERKTVEAEGIAYPTAVWNFYKENCTIRFKNPQAYHEKVFEFLSHLQEYFGSFMGANMYLTPPGSQGFAPHYDDIEAFVLQIEGTKLWKIYAPRNEDEVLPRFSSGNFTQDEIGTPIFEGELQPGDALYFPRGFIHQARTTGNSHSLHLTISTYQKNTWGDIMQVILPRALNIAMSCDVDFRESLPINYLDHIGFANDHKVTPEREEFIKKVKKLSKKLISYLPIDDAVDEHAKDFIHSCLPPCLNIKEKKNSVHGNSHYWKKGVICTASLQLDSKIRLIRKRIFRLVEEDNCVRLYHTLINSRDYKELEIKFVDGDADIVPAIKFLMETYPIFVEVNDIPIEDSSKLVFANDMYNNGFLMTEEPLKTMKK